MLRRLPGALRLYTMQLTACLVLERAAALQAVRNEDDLECLACPPKYRELKTFHRYYTGAAVAPYPTLFSAPCRAAHRSTA